MGYVPESRDIFPRLSVHQNLLLGQKGAATGGSWTFERVYQMFPQLRQRQHTLGGVLSGGEQQMLSLGRALMGDPGLLIVDEPTEGLAPQLLGLVADTLQQLQKQGVAVLLVEQKLAMALQIADRVLLMGHGKVVYAGTPQELQADAGLRREWLGV